MDWMHLTIELPEDDGRTLLIFLKEKFGYKDVDWCEMERPDRAIASYAPCPPRTESRYSPDPFPPA